MPQTPRLQHLLVATDLSARSDKAFERAVRLARSHHARLTVLHVIGDELQPAYAEALRERAREHLKKEVAEAAADLKVNIAVRGGIETERILQQVAEGAERGDLSVEVRIEAGSIYEIVNETADAAQADLVICGAHRKLTIGDEWLGSTMDRVLRFGHRPVLIAKTHPTDDYRKIAVAVDFSEASQSALAFALANFPAASFLVVSANDGSLSDLFKAASSKKAAQEAQERELSKIVEAALARIGASSRPEIKTMAAQGSPVDVLRRCLEDDAPDLVVVGTHGRSGIRRAILGSVAARVISALPCDVLAVRGSAS